MLLKKTHSRTGLPSGTFDAEETCCQEVNALRPFQRASYNQVVGAKLEEGEEGRPPKYHIVQIYMKGPSPVTPCAAGLQSQSSDLCIFLLWHL